MLPPHQPTRRKKKRVGKTGKASRNGAGTKVMARARAEAGSGDEPARPALRVLGREARPSPIVAARKRRIGC
jgi:hypothetical protein